MQTDKICSRALADGAAQMTIIFHNAARKVQPHFDAEGNYHTCVTDRKAWVAAWKQYRAEGMHRSSESGCTVRRGR